MRLMKGHNTNRSWRRLLVVLGGVAVVGVAVAPGGIQISARSPMASLQPSNEKAAPGGVLSIGSHPFALGGGQAAAPAPAATKPLLAEERFKNVQALKGIPVDDFMLTMGIMTSSLGFDCSDCHDLAGTDKVDWAADTPRKVKARKMVLMVKAINKDNFTGRQMVTCFTCHRNRDRPLTTPTMEMLYGVVNSEPDDILAKSDGTPPAEQILDKYIAAIGGAQKVNGLTSYVAKATSLGFGGFGGEGQVQIYAKAPDKRTTIIQFKNAPGRDDNARTYDGKIGWMRTPLSVLGEYTLTGAELDGARFDAQLAFPGKIKQLLRNWRVNTPFSSLDGREVYAVQGDGPRGTLATLYFDKQTGLLSRSLRYGPGPIGRIPTQVDYADYRDVGGVKFPFKYTFAWLDGRDTFTLTEMKTNLPIDEARFGKPSSAKQ